MNAGVDSGKPRQPAADAGSVAAVPAWPSEFSKALRGFSRYLSSERGRSDHTVRAYEGDIAQLLNHALAGGVRTLGGIDLGVLRGWLGELSAAGLARSTLARRAATARSFTGWALREELISTDPALRLRAPKRDKTLPSVLRAGQVGELFEDRKSVV